MNEMALIGFVWNAISGDVIGNAAYDGVKALLGKGFNRLASYAKENKKNDFKIALQAFPCGFRFASEPLNLMRTKHPKDCLY